MSTMTLADLIDLRDKVKAAYERALNGQDIAIGDKRLVQARLATLGAELDRLDRRIAAKSGTGSTRNSGIMRR